MTRRIRSIFASTVALVVLGISVAPGTVSADTAIAAQLRFSFGSDEPRLSLGLGELKERLPARSQPLRSMTFRPLMEVSARPSMQHKRFEDLRLNGLPLGKRMLDTQNGEEESGEEESGDKGSGGRKVALVIGGVVVGTLIVGYILVDDVFDSFIDAIEGN